MSTVWDRRMVLSAKAVALLAVKLPTTLVLKDINYTYYKQTQHVNY